MRRFSPKLEPGEILVGQVPAKPTKRQLLPGALLAVGTGAAFALLPLWLGGIAGLAASICGVGVGLTVFGQAWNTHVWTVALTDRRVLIQPPLPWRPPPEISRAAVESLAMDIPGNRIVIRGGRQEIAVSGMQVNLEAVKRLLEPVLGPAS